MYRKQKDNRYFRVVLNLFLVIATSIGFQDTACCLELDDGPDEKVHILPDNSHSSANISSYDNFSDRIFCHIDGNGNRAADQNIPVALNKGVRLASTGVTSSVQLQVCNFYLIFSSVSNYFHHNKIIVSKTNSIAGLFPLLSALRSVVLLI